MIPQSQSKRIERMVGLCKLWGAIKYFHPYLAYRDDIDWDAVLVTTIPNARGILFDLRSKMPLSQERGYLTFAFRWSEIAGTLSSTSIVTAGERSRNCIYV